MWYVFFLVVGGVSGYLVWDFRRKAARREAISQERFEQIFKAKAASAFPSEASLVAGPAAKVAPIAPTPTPTPTPIPIPIPRTPAAAPALAARERFLAQAETLIYLLLKTGIPDHEIFANVSLASVVGVPGRGYEREQHTRRLSQYQVDFVVCDKSMRIVAAVEVESSGEGLPAGEQAFKEECLKSGGIRLVRINSTALPRRDEIRRLVCGAV